MPLTTRVNGPNDILYKMTYYRVIKKTVLKKKVKVEIELYLNLEIIHDYGFLI